MSLTLISIAILKPPAGPATSLEKYLINAGALVFGTNKPTEFMEKISKEIPDFVFICVDHAPEQIQNSILLIRKALNIPVFGYSLTLGFSAIKLLENLPFDNTFKSDLAGPIVEKTIKQYLKNAEIEHKKLKEEVNKKNQLNSIDVIEFNKQAPRKLVDAKVIKKEMEQTHFIIGKDKSKSNTNEQFSNLFLSCLKSTLNDLNTNIEEMLENEEFSYDISLLHLFEFKFNEHNYYFIVAPLDDKQIPLLEIALLSEVFSKNIKKIKHEIKIKNPLQVLVPRARIKDWLTDNGLTLALTSLWNRPCYLGIIANPSSDSFELKANSENNYFEVSLTTIPINTPLPYTIYILLDLNNKYFPYVSKGQIMSSKILSKISSLKTNSVYIDKEELTLYLQRLAYKNITETLFSYLSKYN